MSRTKVFAPVSSRLGKGRSLGLGLAIGIALAGLGGEIKAAPAVGPDLILTNGRVYTVEAAKPWAQAVAVKDGKILEVGSVAEIARLKRSNTKVVDLGGRLLMPAFGDAHAHPVFGGLSYSRCSLHEGKSLEDYQRIIADCVAKSPGQGTVFGSGWNQALFPPNGVPRKEILDAVTTVRPLIFESDGHTLWVNSKALELANITRETPDPPNGKIDRDPATGEPVGGLEEAAMGLMEKLTPPPTAKDREAAIGYTVKLFNSLGITSWHDAMVEWDASGASAVLDAYKAVKDRGELSVHTALDLQWNNGRGLDQLPDILKLTDRAHTMGLRATGVKFFIDGVIPQQTAAMLAPYEGTTEKGASQIPLETLAEAVTQLDAKGLQAHFHAIGDGGVREALDAVQRARARDGMTDTRPMISHLNVVDPADQPRFGQLGVTAIFQPLWACDEPYMRLTVERIGPKRAGYIYPANSILKAGGKLAYGADWSVASANPLEGIEVALTRIAPGDANAKPLLADEGVTLAQAVQAYTLNVAYVNHLDKQTGSILAGKSADLIVLDRDIFAIPTTEISKAKVLLTLFQGREVFGGFSMLRP
jgi:predicted amidohydrolase YtcJ